MRIPKVSIMIPVYNKAEYLEDCLCSVIQQTINDIEIICVDDGSTDESLSIIEMFRSQDKRIKVLRHKENRGIIHARKSAFIEAEGEYIGFVDADDYIEPDMYEVMHRTAEINGCDFIQCKARTIDSDEKLKSGVSHHYDNALKGDIRCSFYGADIFKKYTRPIRVNLWLSLFNKKLYKQIIPFIKEDAPLRGDDNLLSFFLMYFSQKYCFVNRVFYNYRANETSSNLGNITIDIVKSQIRERAHAIQYAKWFMQKNNIDWDEKSEPFISFTYNIVNYAANILHRYLEYHDNDKEDLIRYFGNCFGGYGLIYYLNEIVGSDINTLNTSALHQELKSVYSSTSWKVTKPLRWVMKTFRGY